MKNIQNINYKFKIGDFVKHKAGSSLDKYLVLAYGTMKDEGSEYNLYILATGGCSGIHRMYCVESELEFIK